MKICPKCGHATSDDSDGFCIKCGAYFSEAPKAQQQSSALASAMGMSAAPARQAAVPVPENGTFEAGFDDMSAGNFPEGVAQWISAIRLQGQPSEEMYGRMLTAMLDCMASTIEKHVLESRSGTAELAMELDSDLITDLIAGLVSRYEGANGADVLGVSAEYMYLVLESFSVYPDLRDVSEIMSKAAADLEAFRASVPPEDENSATVERELAISLSYIALMSEAIDSAIAEAGDERMDKLADYWSSKATLPYANIAFQIATLNAQIAAAKNVGKLTMKLFKKGLAIQVDGFKKSYFGPRV